MSLPSAIGTGLAEMCFVLLSMVAIQSGLRRFGKNIDFCYPYTLPVMLVALIILAAAGNERSTAVITMTMGFLFFASVVFWLISLTNRGGTKQMSNNPGGRPDEKPSLYKTRSIPEPPSEKLSGDPGPRIEVSTSTTPIKLHKIIVSAAIGIAALMAIFPPSVYRPRGRLLGRGYSLLFTLEGHWEVDFLTLVVQWCVVALLAGGIIYYTKNRDPITPDSRNEMDELNELLDTFDKTKSKSSTSSRK